MREDWSLYNIGQSASFNKFKVNFNNHSEQSTASDDCQASPPPPPPPLTLQAAVLGGRHLRTVQSLTRPQPSLAGFIFRPDLAQQPWSAYVSAEDALVTGQDSCMPGHADLIRLCRCRSTRIVLHCPSQSHVAVSRRSRVRPGRPSVHCQTTSPNSASAIEVMHLPSLAIHRVLHYPSAQVPSCT